MNTPNKDGKRALSVGGAFVKDASDGNALTRLSRYETTLLRSVERTLDQLRRLRAERGAA
jgi:hypothetical protein